MTEIFGYTFEHIALAEPIGNPVTMYRVTMEDGWCIKPPQITSETYKTVTVLYARHDLSQTIIIPISELPDGATLLGGDTKPETEVM